MSDRLQAEAAECGLACIAYVAAHHGMHIGLPELRMRFPQSLRGARLDQVISIARQLHLQPRPLRVELGALRDVQLPCILHWNMDHYVVLKKIRKGRAVIFDPMLGHRSIEITELSRAFTGVALELCPGGGFAIRPPSPAVTLRELTGPIRGLPRSVSQLLVLSLSLQLFVMLGPLHVQWVVDQVLVSADDDLLVVLGLGFTLLLAVQLAMSLARGLMVVQLSSQVGLQWMVNVLAHLLRLPLDFFEKRHLGDITSRIASIQTIQKTLTTGFIEATIDGAMALTLMGVMLSYSPALAAITLLSAAAYLMVRTLAYRRLRDGTERQLLANARQQTYLLESLRGIQSIKIAGREPTRLLTFRNLLVAVVNQDIKLGHLQLIFGNANTAIFGLERIAVIWFGASLALSGAFSVGMLMAYLAYKELFTTRIGSLIDKAIEFRMLRLHGERLADIVLAEPDVDARTEGHQEIECPRIEADNVSFRYGPGEPWIVRNCSFTIEAGESVAIIGPSGCGKTTLIKLMLGLRSPEEGTIRIGGVEVHGPASRSARALMGAVMQDDQLFAGNLAENICFFDTHPDLERIELAARRASIHEDICAMPMGYRTMVGDMGCSLSGGQKQRVVLARALYREPRLLFLDEATSHLDERRELSVNAAIRDLSLTRIIVAHRADTIASADRILAVENGELREWTPSPNARRAPADA